MGPPAPCPRFENHYMYQMSYRVEVPVTSISDGTALVMIVPLCAPCSAYDNQANFPRMPFISVAAGSTNNPFATAPSYSPNGPFASQSANIMTYAIDSVQIDFIET